MFNGQRNKVIASLLLPSMLIAAGLFLVVQIAPPVVCSEVIIKGGDRSIAELKAGDLAYANFSIINISPFPIGVYSQPACGCTVTSARSNIVGPFNNLTVYSTINTSLFPVGLTRKKIRLSFSEGDLRWTRVQILTVLVQRA